MIGNSGDYVFYDEETVLQLYNQADGFLLRIIELIR
jgi:protein involved in polysaccharide export with SLBB domain